MDSGTSSDGAVHKGGPRFAGEAPDGDGPGRRRGHPPPGPCQPAGSRSTGGKGDGPGRGDNRGRRRAMLRGGGAGAPARSTPKGERALQWWPFYPFIATLRTECPLICPLARATGTRPPPQSGHIRPPGPPASRPGVRRRARSPLTCSRSPAPHERWHPADGVPSTVSRPGLPGVHTHMSHRDKPATIGPSVDCPRVGARLAHGGRRRTLVSRLVPFLPQPLAKHKP